MKAYTNQVSSKLYFSHDFQKAYTPHLFFALTEYSLCRILLTSL